MVHQQVDIEIGRPDRLCDRSVGPPQIAAPVRQPHALFLMLRNMAAMASGCEYPCLAGLWMDLPGTVASAP